MRKTAYLRAFSYYLDASSTATATATVAPTMGLLPMPMRPIISTCRRPLRGLGMGNMPSKATKSHVYFVVNHIIDVILRSHYIIPRGFCQTQL